MDFRHLVESAYRSAKVVLARRQKKRFSFGDVSCFAIQHVYQQYVSSEKFKAKSSDREFIESAVYNACLRAVEDRRVFRATDAMEHQFIDDMPDKTNEKHEIAACNLDGDDDDNTSDILDQYGDFKDNNDFLRIFEMFDSNFKKIIKSVSLPVAKVILSEISDPSPEMQRWILVEEFRIRGTEATAKMHYRSFEAIYGISQQEYHVALRHIRRHVGRMNIFEN